MGVWPPLWRGLTFPSALNTLTWIALFCRLDLCDYVFWSTLSSTLYPTNLFLSKFSCSWAGSINRPFYSCELGYLAFFASEAKGDNALIQTYLLFLSNVN